MTSRFVPSALRARVAAQAGTRCGYCQSDEQITGQRLHVEHLLPLARGGMTTEDNLWLACGDCNARKGELVAGVDSETGHVAPLYNPCAQIWTDHFAWSADGAEVIGLTEIGRATVALLELNRPALVVARRRWVSVGWHPPR